MRAVVRVDDFTVWGRHIRAGERLSGFVASRKGLQGFLDGVDRQVQEQARPWRDGVFPVPSTMSGRVLSVDGIALARDWPELMALRRQLMGVLSGGGFSTLAFDDGDRVYRTEVALLGKPVFTADRWVPDRASFQIQFRAPDPYWLGDDRTVSVRVGQTSTVFQYGTVEVAPVVKLVGPLNSGVRVTVGDRAFSFGRAVGSGESVTVDQATMRAVSSTAGLVMGVVTGVPLRVPKRGEVPVSVSGGGSGRVEVRVVDAYV